MSDSGYTKSLKSNLLLVVTWSHSWTPEKETSSLLVHYRDTAPERPEPLVVRLPDPPLPNAGHLPLRAQKISKATRSKMAIAPPMIAPQAAGPSASPAAGSFTYRPTIVRSHEPAAASAPGRPDPSRDLAIPVGAALVVVASMKIMAAKTAERVSILALCVSVCSFTVFQILRVMVFGF